MKIVTSFILLMLCTSGLWAKGPVNPILFCLGQEELLIHKNRIMGPINYLNQEMIGRYTAINSLRIRPHLLERICNNKKYASSLALLEMLLLEGDKIFDFSYRAQTGKQVDMRSYERNYVESLVEEAPHIFIQFLSRLNYSSNNPHCLQKNIPEVKRLLDRYKYLEGEISRVQLLEKGVLLKNIFKKLNSLGTIFKKCKRVIKK